jgi:hypothetical protein
VLDQRRGGAHDCLVVTLLVVVVVAGCAELVVALVGWAELVVVVAGCAEVVATVVVLRDASAGSWPLTSSTAISAHVAKNRATAPVATRRLIVRVRARRACLTSPAGTGGGLDDIVGSSQLRTAHW